MAHSVSSCFAHPLAQSTGKSNRRSETTRTSELNGMPQPLNVLGVIVQQRLDGLYLGLLSALCWHTQLHFNYNNIALHDYSWLMVISSSVIGLYLPISFFVSQSAIAHRMA